MFLFLFYRSKILSPILDDQLKVGTPRFIFPYYPRMKEKIEMFSDFEIKHEEDNKISTIAVDCLKYRTQCAKYHLNPGKLYISIFDHENPSEIVEEINPELLEELHNRSINHGYIKITTEEEVNKYANEKPLFLFVTRPNAGDLQQKKPVFARIASHNIGRKLIFGYVTNPVLYEQYAKYPYNAFVYVSPSGKHLTFRGDFNMQQLEFFINQHSQPVLGDPVTKDKSIVVVGNEEFYESAKDKLVDFQTITPIVYINASENMQKASYFCDGKYQCISIVDFSRYSVVPCGANIDILTIQTNINTFDTVWKSYPLQNRIYTALTVSYSLHPNEYYMLGSIIALLIIYLLFYSLDSSRILLDK